MIALHLLLFGALISLASAAKWHVASNGKSFLIEDEQKFNWLQAHTECAKQNLQLLEIHDGEQNKALTALLKNAFPQPINLWLGANNEYSNSKKFVWSSSGIAMPFKNWAANQPSHLDTHYCAHITASQDFKWSNSQCSIAMGYVCEEHKLQVEFRERLEVKRQHVAKVLKEAFGDYLSKQKQEIAMLKHNIELAQKKENELKVTLPEDHRKMQETFTLTLKDEQTQQAKLMEDTVKQIAALQAEMQSKITATRAKYETMFDAAQKEIAKLLVWDGELK